MFGGELIHEREDDYGKIQVVDIRQQYRSLHFNTPTHQSSMLLQNPFLLVHKYTQAMMLPLCLLNVQQVLLFGLGAGSIVKYIYNYFPDVEITAIELRDSVIDIAREYFLLPDEDTRFNLFNQNAIHWLDQTENSKQRYQLIFIDMFLSSLQGEDYAVDIDEKIKQLSDLLSPDGVLVFNHLASDENNYKAVKERLIKDRQLSVYEIWIDFSNTVVLASKSSLPAASMEQLYACEKQTSSLFKHYYDCLKPLENR